VVKAQYHVVDQPFDQVEGPPAQDQLAAERQGCWQHQTAPAVSHQPIHTSQGQEPHGRVEETVPPHVQPQRLQCHRRYFGGCHVVPMHDLVEKDAVHETSQTQAEKNSGKPAKAGETGVFGHARTYQFGPFRANFIGYSGSLGGCLPYSMTGFGAAEGPVAGRRLRVEIRTVNHRYFNLSAKLPGDLSALEGELRERLRRDFERGHVSVQARWTESAEGGNGFEVDLDRARLVVARLRELQSSLGLGGEVTLDLVARQPAVLGSGANGAGEIAWTEVEPVVAQAGTECRAMRAREGKALTDELAHRLDLLERTVQEIAARAPERLVRERDRLRVAVGQLLDGRSVDEGRLAQELAFLADKLDITEELVRFRAHVAAARDALRTDGPIGKRLGFLAQELGREVNTMGAKAGDAAIAQSVIAMKGELEKFREQLENLE
jgi:uncharacterized protein (TIGR00255 family)